MSKIKWKKPVNAFLSTLLAASIVTPTIPTYAETGHAAELLISEYIEGSSYNKAIELYNGTGSAIDLSQYKLELYVNGATSASQTLTLSGTLKAGKTYVIYNNSANSEIKSKGNLANSTVINFNGDDPVVLKKGNTVIDSIGQVGQTAKNMADVTLVRKANITTGDTIINDAFNPSTEWNQFPIDDATDLGKHTMDGSTVEEPGNPDDPGPAQGIQIHDIQGASHQSPKLGETVSRIEGIVTYVYKIGSSNYFHMQTPDDQKGQQSKHFRRNCCLYRKHCSKR